VNSNKYMLEACEMILEFCVDSILTVRFAALSDTGC
jgi:hypothetical protein